MGLANFFHKSALAASQILKGYDRTEFESRLLKSPIEVAFDKSVPHSSEGKVTLELTIRLLARLYPQIIITQLDTGTTAVKKQMEELSRSINPAIEFDAVSPVATVSVGNTKIQRDTPIFYIGSDNWRVLFSSSNPVSSGNSPNPFAAGAAACFGSANIFRHVFGDQLQNAQTDESFSLSLLDFEKNNEFHAINSSGIGNKIISIPEVFLVGLGAIGNGFAWALSKIPSLDGTLHLIDPESVDLSNLQRYVLAEQHHVNKVKTELVKCFLASTSLNVVSHNETWSSFLGNRQNWMLDTVVVAVDSAHDRIAIQSSLPKHILNAWTQPIDVGISRHDNFLKDACLACLYPPEQGLKPESVLVAESFGLLGEEPQIRELIYNNVEIDHFWLAKIAAGRAVPIDVLTPYLGLPIRKFYQTVFCSGVLIGYEQNKQIETPMAFQSALAGIILGAELIIKTLQLRTCSVGNVTKINLLKPMSEYVNEIVLKPSGYNCICQDLDFKNQYESKYY